MVQADPYLQDEKLARMAKVFPTVRKLMVREAVEFLVRKKKKGGALLPKRAPPTPDTAHQLYK